MTVPRDTNTPNGVIIDFQKVCLTYFYENLLLILFNYNMLIKFKLNLIYFKYIIKHFKLQYT